MPRKLADIPNSNRCSHPEHEFPSMWLPPESGVYEHVCPACGEQQTTEINLPTL